MMLIGLVGVVLDLIIVTLLLSTGVNRRSHTDADTLSSDAAVDSTDIKTNATDEETDLEVAEIPEVDTDPPPSNTEIPHVDIQHGRSLAYD